MYRRVFRQKRDTFIRIYGSIGYILNEGLHRDKVFDEAGAAFLAQLSRSPQSVSHIAMAISRSFQSVPPDFEDDVLDFLNMLEAEGFIVGGESAEELDAIEVTGVRSIDAEPSGAMLTAAFATNANIEDTQTYLTRYFENEPQLMSLQLELTSVCNERCVHCYIPHEAKTDAMSLEMFDDVLRQASDMGLISLTLSGGEPLAHPRFLEMLQHVREYDFSVRILSNLTLLKDEILGELKRTNIASVKASLYSMKPEAHDAITCLPGSHAKTLRAIERLADSGIRVLINCPTMKENVSDLREVLQWGAKRNIRTVTDYIMMARYDGTSDNLEHRLTIDQIEPLIRDVIEKDLEYGDRLLKTDFQAERSKDVSNDPVCGVCISSLSMVPNGNLYPCAGWQGYVLGNIKDQTLADIWNSSERVRYLRNLRMKDFPQCLKCDDRPFCAMCMVRNANENPDGNPLVVNEHFCKVAALNRRVAEEWIAHCMPA